MKEIKAPLPYKIALTAAVVLAVFAWWHSRVLRSGWFGVPPAPAPRAMQVSALGDSQFAYRMNGMTLQNLGNQGGKATPLTEYNYDRLEDWFFALYALDPKSDFVPMLAAYYFGATRDPEDSMNIVNFLAVAGDSPEGEKWRWLAQAVYLARFRSHDLDLSLKLAYRLADLSRQNPDIPLWARHMPAFVLNARGEKDAARQLMMAILGSTETLNPNEINFMKTFIENRLGGIDGHGN